MLGTVAAGMVRESRKFRAPIYRAHRAVIFATAQLSCSAVLQSLTSMHSSVLVTVVPCVLESLAYARIILTFLIIIIIINNNNIAVR